LIIDAGQVSRVFNITTNGTVSISNLTIQKGKVIDQGGAGIELIFGATLLLNNVSILNNSAVKSSGSFFIRGGGIDSIGTLTITNSNINNNTADFQGGGIFFSSGVLSLQNVAVNNNNTHAGNSGTGGGIAVNSATSAIFDSIHVSGNLASSAGGISISDTVTTNLSNSLIANNTAADGAGGLSLSGFAGQTVNITNTTISGNVTNTSFSTGGGILINSNSPSYIINLTHTTITQNTADGAGGGIRYSDNGTVNLQSSILAGNTSTTTANADCDGPIVSQDYNIIQDTDGCTITGTTTNNITAASALLNPLADNGGSTDTHALQALSPALDAIPLTVNGCGTSYVLDQRGVSRPQNGSCEIGAYEVDPTPLTVSSSVRAGVNPTSASYVNFIVVFSEAVTGVDISDFTLTTAGVSGAAVSSVSGSGSVYTVTVNTGTGNGTLRLDIPLSATITDLVIGLPFTTGESYTISKLPIFSDVPFNGFANSFIERLFNAGVTGGCSVTPLNYCPDNSVTRAQMAIFPLRGIHGSGYTPPAVGVSTGFADVATDAFAAAFIKQLAAEGVTSGCGNGNYCPDAFVTRAQMAIFLLKAKNGSSFTPPAVGVSTGFADVATNAFAAAFIKQLVADGITSGCGNGNYCPDSDVTRAQMAIFLVKAFNLP